MTNKIKISPRNGDWTFRPVEEFTNLEKGIVINHKGSAIFATGEATNHHHVIEVPKIDDMELIKMPDGYYYVNIKSEEAKVTHPEHSMIKDLIVPKGKYILYQRREKDWFSLATRKVID